MSDTLNAIANYVSDRLTGLGFVVEGDEDREGYGYGYVVSVGDCSRGFGLALAGSSLIVNIDTFDRGGRIVTVFDVSDPGFEARLDGLFGIGFVRLGGC